MRVRILGIGTPFGDDAVGPRVVERLTRAGGLPRGVEARSCRRPLDLIDWVHDADAAVLVDATRSGLPAGSVHEPAVDALEEARPVSSHGLGVREALAMARALGRAPKRLAIVGIEASSLTGDGLSPEVEAALDEAAARVLRRCAAWLDPTPAAAREHA